MISSNFPNLVNKPTVCSNIIFQKQNSLQKFATQQKSNKPFMAKEKCIKLNITYNKYLIKYLLAAAYIRVRELFLH